ncbi:hypothetical protein [Rubrobacter marinus]|uniref:hypothetical protein n=1 Tax=Rubrobacter marinus TaxID=2653852 RepID=UPI001A9ED7DC|nr:hypothetical protein [Rubrobacter marinus]
MLASVLLHAGAVPGSVGLASPTPSGRPFPSIITAAATALATARPAATSMIRRNAPTNDSSTASSTAAACPARGPPASPPREVDLALFELLASFRG